MKFDGQTNTYMVIKYMYEKNQEENNMSGVRVRVGKKNSWFVTRSVLTRSLIDRAVNKLAR
jgi:hypothetical protein